MLFHLVARTRNGLLFVTWEEGRALWDRIVAAIPGLKALVVMPDHVHLLHEQDVRRRLAQALAGYMRWRNHRRGTLGPSIAPLPAAEPLVDAQKVRRSLRYIHLNPCRARLVADPLALPLSTHRDAVGLAVGPVVGRQRDPAGFHQYVSADPTVRVDGTELPLPNLVVPDPTAVLHATSAALRVPLPALSARGPARSLFLRAARTLTSAPHREIGDLVGVRRQAVCLSPRGEDAAVRIIATIAGDPRFPPLWNDDLRRQPSWARYRRLPG